MAASGEEKGGQKKRGTYRFLHRLHGLRAKKTAMSLMCHLCPYCATDGLPSSVKESILTMPRRSASDFPWGSRIAPGGERVATKSLSGRFQHFCDEAV